MISLREKLEASSQPDPTTGCWIWARRKTKRGYGIMAHGGRETCAHRFAHEAFIGAIPPGHEVDHLCKNPSCINPAHLEAVPPMENWRRSDSLSVHHANKTHCKNGHEFTPENTSWRPGKRKSRRLQRRCRACACEVVRRMRARKKSNALITSYPTVAELTYSANGNSGPHRPSLTAAPFYSREGT